MRRFVFSVSESEALRLYEVLLDEDKEEALAFLREHASIPLRKFFQGG